MNLTLNISKLQVVKLQLNLLINFVGEIILSNIDLEYLAYFIVYGNKEGRRKLIEDEVSLSKAVWSNKLGKFRREGILTGKGKDTILNPLIKIKLESFEYNLLINVQ